MEVDAAGLQGEDLLSVRFERSLEVKSVEAGRKIVRFHLVSSQGKEYVAACGEDYGGSHYHYYAMPDFAAHFPFRGHNKRDVGAWMDSVIKGSQERNPPAPVSAPAPLPTVLEPPPPPMVEQPMLQPHLEQPGFNDPSQGQFYSQQGPGEVQQPGILNIPHARGTGSKKAPKKRPAATPGGGGSKSRSGANKNAGVKHRLTGVAHEAHIKRLKRIAAESQQVLRASQAAFLMRLRRQAALEATHREGAKQLTACWVRGDPSEDETAVLSQWLKTLKDLLNNANKKQLQALQYIEVELPLKTGEMMDMAPRIEFRDVPSTSSHQQGREGATDPMMVMTYGPPTHAASSQHPSSTNEPTTAGTGTGGGGGGGGGVSGVSGVSGEAGGVGHAEAGHSRGEPHPHPQQQPAAVSAPAPSAAANPEVAKQEAPEKEVVQGDREEKLRSWPCSHGLPGKVVEASTWSYTEPYLHKHGLRLVLECLRELGALCFPMKPMAEHNVIGTVRAFAETHPHPAVTRLAHQLLGRWQRAALQHVALLTSPEALRDPVRELERKIAFDQVVYPDDIQAKQQVLEAQEALFKATIANPAGSAASSLHHTNSLLDSLPSMPPECAAMELLSGRVDPSISAMEGAGFSGAAAGTPAMPSYHSTAAPDALGPGGSTQAAAAGAGTQVQGYGEVAGFGGVGSGVPFAPGPGLFPGSAAAAFPASGAKGLPYGSAQQQGGLADFFMMDAE